MFGRPAAMETVASLVMKPEIFISIWSPVPLTKLIFRLSPPILPFFVINSILYYVV